MSAIKIRRKPRTPNVLLRAKRSNLNNLYEKTLNGLFAVQLGCAPRISPDKIANFYNEAISTILCNSLFSHTTKCLYGIFLQPAMLLQ